MLFILIKTISEPIQDMPEKDYIYLRYFDVVENEMIIDGETTFGPGQITQLSRKDEIYSNGVSEIYE
jgi:hypothetical protein